MRPFNRRQALQNAAFLAALRRTGNPRLAARELGVHRSTYTKRRAKSAAFASEWDAAILACHAALKLGGGPHPPEGDGLRTIGGEIVVGRTRGGRLQLRRSPPGRMTEAAEQGFLAALSASANVRLSAAAVGFAHSSFYHRRRVRPVFAREMRISLTIGYDRVEFAALAASLPGSGRNDGWRQGPLPPLAPLSWDQAFQLLCLHDRSVRQGWEQPHRRRRRGEPLETYTERLRAMWTAEKAREAEDRAVRRAEHYERTGGWRYAHEQKPPPLPPLHLVTGWSKATGKPAHNPDLALFGGWRISDWKKRQGKE